jgi:hypothetical protein
LSELKEIVITEKDYREYLRLRLRLTDPCMAEEVERVGFPFLFASGSELLRSYILNETEFISSLPDTLKMPDRGYAWYMFAQSVREILVNENRILVKYELQDDYRRPFKRFYL